MDASQFRLAFVQLGCPSYKREMFEKIATLPNVKLSLFIGDIHPIGHAPNGDMTGLQHILLKNRIYKFMGLQFVWQSINKHLSPKEFDLILLPEGVLYFSNYLLMLRAWLSGVPVGFYSHGFNHQRKETFFSSILEFTRRFVHRRVDVIITYSQSGADFIEQTNPAMIGRVHVALNTLDVEAINNSVSILSSKEMVNIRSSFGFNPGDVVLAFVGRVSSEKNPHYVIDTVRQLRSEGLSVRALFIGNGPAMETLQLSLLNETSDIQNSVKFTGRVSASQVGPLLKSADISVMPGMTGLAIVHSFAVGLPYVTISSPLHSPEIEYLIPGVNGLITSDTPDSFTNGVRQLVVNSELRAEMGASGKLHALSNININIQMAGFVKAIDFIKYHNQENT